MKSMNELMLHFLQDVYDAERRGLRALPKLARAAQSEALKAAIMQHREQSEQQVARLDGVFEVLNKRPRGKACKAMIGLAEELDEAISEGEKGPVLDAALIAAAQAVEHYEMARYGALLAWAKQAGMTEAVDLLQQTLDEEKASDQRLTQLAEGQTNPQAAEMKDDEEEPDEDKPAPRRRASTRRAAEPEPPPAKPAAKTTRRTPVRKPAAAPSRGKRK